MIVLLCMVMTVVLSMVMFVLMLMLLCMVMIVIINCSMVVSMTASTSNFSSHVIRCIPLMEDTHLYQVKAESHNGSQQHLKTQDLLWSNNSLGCLE
jgi:hypothetical protein